MIFEYDPNHHTKGIWNQNQNPALKCIWNWSKLQTINITWCIDREKMDVGKHRIGFVVPLNFFRYLLRLRRYERKSVEVGVFRRGWVTLSAYFRGKGASLTNHCWCQKTRAIAVSCGITISAVHHLVLSQYTRLTYGRTDRQTELR